MNTVLSESGPVCESSLMGALKQTTAGLHLEAENHPFQKALAAGKLDRNAYIAYLDQMLLIHRTLEEALRELRRCYPMLAEVILDEQFQEPHLRSDLAYYGAADPAGVAMPCVVAYQQRVERLRAERGMELLGHHYVLEGSKNGAKFMARSVRAAFGLTPGAGDRFLDPYGEEQRAKWLRFRSEMDRVPFTREQREAILVGACDMFRTMIRLAEELS